MFAWGPRSQGQRHRDTTGGVGAAGTFAGQVREARPLTALFREQLHLGRMALFVTKLTHQFGFFVITVYFETNGVVSKPVIERNNTRASIAMNEADHLTSLGHVVFVCGDFNTDLRLLGPVCDVIDKGRWYDFGRSTVAFIDRS